MKELFKGFLANKRETTLQFVFIFGILITVNILAKDWIVRLDLTENNRYTLSEASRDIAKEVDDPVTVTAYFSSDLPPQLERGREEFRNFLEEFRAYSGDNLEYRFVDPNESQQKGQEAQQSGVRPVMLDVRKKDQVSQRKAYIGAVFQYHDKTQPIPVIQSGSGMEYKIAQTVKQLTAQNKPKVGLLAGHGEPSGRNLQQLRSELGKLYNVVDVGGIDTTAVPADIEVLMVIRPTEKLSTEELRHIDQYIMAGGKAVFAINRVRTMVQRGRAMEQKTGVERLLAGYNIPVNVDLVRDANASPINVRQQQGAFSVVNQVRYPYIPQIHNFSNHPISKGLENVIFRFVSSIDTTMAGANQKITVLAKSSDKSASARQPFDLNPMQDWDAGDFTGSNIPVAAVMEGTFKSAFANSDSVEVPLNKSKKTSIVVFGDGDFVVNEGGRGRGQQMQQVPQDNLNLMVNSVDWLADNSGLMALRTQTVTSRPLMTLKDSTKALLKYLNIFVPILLVLGFGFYRTRRKKARRSRWIEEGV